MLTISEVESLLGTAIPEDTFEAASAATIRAINAQLPRGVTVETLTDADDVNIVETVFTSVIARVLSNPTGAGQLAAEGASATFSNDGGISPYTLRRFEREQLSRVRAGNEASRIGNGSAIAKARW